MADEIEVSPKPSPSTYSTTSLTARTIDEQLPCNVSLEEDLVNLPEETLSGNKQRPLRHVTEDGQEYHYALQPMFYSVIFILLVELLERFSFYGVNYTQTSFLTGVYNRNWNAGMDSIAASSYVSISTAVAYTTPFLGAFLADSVFGDYKTILFGSVCFYLPGLILILVCSIPYFLGETFHNFALSIGLLVLWPIGTGVVKSVVNVFGAKQFHPLLQSALIEAYYVKFYMCINIGALIGGAIGNRLGEGGGKSGATALGALIGSEVVRNEKAEANQNFVEKEVCRVQKVIHTETTEQISGYKLIIDVDGETIQMNSNRSYNPGDLITLTKKISYSLN